MSKTLGRLAPRSDGSATAKKQRVKMIRFIKVNVGLRLRGCWGGSEQSDPTSDLFLDLLHNLLGKTILSELSKNEFVRSSVS